MKKLLPIILMFIGIGAGVGAGVLLKPAPEETALINPCGPGDDNNHGGTDEEGHSEDNSDEEDSEFEYVKMNNQFIVPIVTDGKMSALIVLSLNLEVRVGEKETAFQREPKLRSAFNQVLFDHANAGGFNGVFTNSTNMITLEESLFEIGQTVLGPRITDVLISDIIRQDID